MKILAIDSSAKSASVCVNEDGEILSSFYINAGLTHSRTLLPMIDSALKTANLCINDIDLLSCSTGPGSYTGLRIGIATIKGLAAARKLPSIGVSTLEALAYNLIQNECIACAVMDARCGQVYTASFDITKHEVLRLSADRAIPIEELQKELEKYEKPIVFVGDGAEICHKALGFEIAQEEVRYQNAKSVAKLAILKKDEAIDASVLNPTYLRLPQAERELRARKKINQEGL